jgi:hypothetical protein
MGEQADFGITLAAIQRSNDAVIELVRQFKRAALDPGVSAAMTHVLLVVNAVLVVVNGALLWRLSQALRQIRRAQR